MMWPENLCFSVRICGLTKKVDLSDRLLVQHEGKCNHYDQETPCQQSDSTQILVHVGIFSSIVGSGRARSSLLRRRRLAL